MLRGELEQLRSAQRALVLQAAQAQPGRLHAAVRGGEPPPASAPSIRRTARAPQKGAQPQPHRHRVPVAGAARVEHRLLLPALGQRGGVLHGVRGADLSVRLLRRGGRGVLRLSEPGGGRTRLFRERDGVQPLPRHLFQPAAVRHAAVRRLPAARPAAGGERARRACASRRGTASSRGWPSRRRRSCSP